MHGMDEMDKTAKGARQRTGMGCGSALLLIFIILKLTKLITWSWIWVLSPIWIPVAGVIAVLGSLALIAGIFRMSRG